jgi:glutamate 5-kinase
MIDLVGKVGSMALIDRDKKSIDYNVFAQISMCLRPGYVWVTSGATEIGRIDYMKRGNVELAGDPEENKTDYAAQGQSILMENYRKYVNSSYSIRQFLVEHQNFNDTDKREYLRRALERTVAQNAIPIVNYNDAVSDVESRKLEIQSLKNSGKEAVECIDNDETASQIACILKCKKLLILSSVDGIYMKHDDPKTLVHTITDETIDGLLRKVDVHRSLCKGASRVGANGAAAKLAYIKEPLKNGTTVIIASSRYSIDDILRGLTPQTRIGLNLEVANAAPRASV